MNMNMNMNMCDGLGHADQIRLHRHVGLLALTLAAQRAAHHTVNFSKPLYFFWTCPFYSRTNRAELSQSYSSLLLPSNCKPHNVQPLSALREKELYSTLLYSTLLYSAVLCCAA